MKRIRTLLWKTKALHGKYHRQTEDVAKIVYGHICTIYRLEVRNSQSEIPPQDVENNSAVRLRVPDRQVAGQPIRHSGG